MTTVALVQCDNYEIDQVRNAARRGIHLLGGAGCFAAPGEKLLLKPNLLAPDPPDRCVTTHPAVFQAVAEIFLETGARLSYGDSPGFGNTEKAARRAGLLSIAEDLHISMGNFSEGERVSFPDGDIQKFFILARAVQEAQGVISLPKLKTHALTIMTGAVKNQFGCIPGLLKGEFHARLSAMQHFVTMLVDLTRCIKPRLYVMDGIIAMEGNGPRSGKPRNLGVLLFGTDPVALDATACRMIGIPPDRLDILVAGQKGGLGTMKKDQIHLVGDPLSSFATVDFDLPRAATLMGRVQNRHVRDALVARPQIVEDKCVRCGICVQVCPVNPKALAWEDATQDKIPVYSYDRCIRCYCCQELCPEGAITLATPILGRALNVLKPPVSSSDKKS